MDEPRHSSNLRTNQRNDIPILSIKHEHAFESPLFFESRPQKSRQLLFIAGRNESARMRDSRIARDLACAFHEEDSGRKILGMNIEIHNFEWRLARWARGKNKRITEYAAMTVFYDRGDAFAIVHAIERVNKCRNRASDENSVPSLPQFVHAF